MEKIEEELLETIAGDDVRTGAYNIRENGKGVERQVTENVKIETKKDGIRNRYLCKRKYKI